MIGILLRSLFYTLFALAELAYSVYWLTVVPVVRGQTMDMLWSIPFLGFTVLFTAVAGNSWGKYFSERL